MKARLKESHPQELEAQLAEKDELIDVLTGQLELAVERLDRLRRAGADRPGIQASQEPGSPPPGSPPAAAPGTIADPELGERLSTVVDEWNELRPIERMDRIEEGLARLLEMVAQRPLIHPESSSRPASNTEFWEQTKARLIGGHADSSSSPESPAKTSGAYDAPSPYDDEIELDLPPSPCPVEAGADAPALYVAVESRDQYIRYLTERLRQVQREKWFPTQWDQLQNAPNQYRERLQKLDLMLHEQMRQSEIATSLERADLTRERAKLNEMKHNLEMQIKRLTTNHPVSPPPPAPAEPPHKDEADSRWKRLFSR